MLVVLAGLFGMHGLDAHGTGPVDHVTSMRGPANATRMAAKAVSASVATPQSPTAYEASKPSVAAPRVAEASPVMNMNMSMTGVCLAVLAAGLLVLFWLLRRARTPALLWTWSRPTTQAVRHSRDPAPPSLTVLSIQRC